MYHIVYTKNAIQDIDKLKSANLDKKAKLLIGILAENPYKTPPEFKKLQGNLNGAYSRRINIKHRFVYEIFDDEKIVKVISMWSHYEF